MNPPVCGDNGGVSKAGTPCRANLAPGATLCVHHDPAQAEEMARRRAKGNASRSRLATTAKAAQSNGVPRAPKNLEDAVTWSAWAMHAVANGTLDARVGHEIGYLVNAFKAALEKRDLLREIEQLRRDLAEARGEKVKPVLGIHRGQ